MSQFVELVKRNMRIYLRDRGAVFFSLMSMVVVIVLMLFFLGDMNVNALTGFLKDIQGRDAAEDEKNAKLVVLMWTCSGIISINAVTVTLSSLAAMIKDRTTGKINAIYTSPVSRVVISAGYICSAWLSSVVVCTATLAITEVYCVMQGAEAFSFIVHLKLLGMITVNSFTYAAIMYIAAIAAKTEGAWSGLGTIVGTLVGFLGGIYLPIGSIADGIASAMKCTPVIYSTVMFRNVMTKPVLESLFSDVPQDMLNEYSDVMGITLNAFNNEITVTTSLIILLVCGLAFLMLGAFLIGLKKKTDR